MSSSTLSHEGPIWIANAPERAIQRDHPFASRPSHGPQDPSQELTHAESPDKANLRALNNFHKTFTKAPLNWKRDRRHRPRTVRTVPREETMGVLLWFRAGSCATWALQRVVNLRSNDHSFCEAARSCWQHRELLTCRVVSGMTSTVDHIACGWDFLQVWRRE